MKPQVNIKLRSQQSPDPVIFHGGPAVMTIWELTIEGGAMIDMDNAVLLEAAR